MAHTLSKGRIKLSWESGTRSDGLSALNKVRDEIILGSAEWPKLAVQFTHGTGAYQCDEAWGDSFTLSTATSTTLVLRGAGANLVNGRGETVEFSKIKAMLVVITDPAAGKRITISGVWGGFVTRNFDQETVWHSSLKLDPITGQAVAASGDTLVFANPSAGVNPTTFGVALLGLKV